MPPEVEQAEAHYRQALALAEELGMRPLQAHCHRGLGTLYGRVGRAEQARAALSTAIALYRAMEMTFWLPQAEAALAAGERLTYGDSDRASRRTWPAISDAVRCRRSPILPVRQNAQPIAQPTWVETQNVCFGVSGMKTDSICLPSSRRNTNFCVPSSET